MKSKEAILQSNCIKWFRLQYPNDIIFAIPNGGSRNVIEAFNLKKQGVLAGVPDVFLAKPNNTYNGLFIEFKHGKGRLTDSQKNIIDKLNGAGYKCEVCYSFYEFTKLINSYF